MYRLVHFEAYYDQDLCNTFSENYILLLFTLDLDLKNEKTIPFSMIFCYCVLEKINRHSVLTKLMEQYSKDSDIYLFKHDFTDFI